MARAHLYLPIASAAGDVLEGISVRLLEPATTTPITQTIYSGPTGSASYAPPFVVATGVLDIYLDTPRRVRIGITPPGQAEFFLEDVDVLTADLVGDTGPAGPAGPRGFSVSSVIVARTADGGTHYADGTPAGNTTAIQSALNSLTGSQSPTLILGEGVYSGLGQLTLPDIPNLRVRGAGKNKTVLQFNNLAVPCIVKAAPLTQRYKYHLSGFTIDNLSKANAGGVGLSLENLSNSMVSDVVITNVETAVRLVGSAYFNRFIDVDVEECGTGEKFDTNAGGNYPNENLFLGVKHAMGGGGTGVDKGVDLLGGNDNHWVACSFEDFLTAIDISDIGNTFTNCRFECNDRTGTVIYVRFNAGGNNNALLNCYLSGNKWVDRATSIIDSGAGNSILSLSTYKDQFFRAERNAANADTLVEMKRSGSGDLKAVYSAEDTYAASGAPVSFLAKHVRTTGKFFSGLLAGVEKWFVTADGSPYFAGTMTLDSLAGDPSANPASGSYLYALAGALKYRGAAGDGGAGGNRFLHNRDIEALSAGTAYTLTATMANVAFGTTSPLIVVPSTGTYLALVTVQVDVVGASYTAGDHWIEVKLRNTSNNTDLSKLYKIPMGTLTGAMTTATGTIATCTFPVKWSQATASHNVQVQARVDALPSAGSVQITQAQVSAFRLF